MEVVIGTYEEIITGFKLIESDEGYVFEPSFTDHFHTGCVRTMAASVKGVLASGSTDERIRLFNLRTRVELGSLIHHEGTISRVLFFGKKHMFSASEDGTIAIWQIGKWECLRTLRGHKGPVYDIDTHPSGRLALSVGKDKTMRTWNLITGKCAYVSNIKEVAEKVLWSADGNTYTLICGNKIKTFNIGTATLHHEVTLSFRIETARVLSERHLVVGGERGLVEIHDMVGRVCVHQFSTNTNRVKDLHVCHDPSDHEDTWVVTASSDGNVKVWWIHEEEGEWKHDLVAKTETTFRPVCLTTYVDTSKSRAKRQQVAVEAAQEDPVEANGEGDSDEASDSDEDNVDDSGDDNGIDKANIGETSKHEETVGRRSKAMNKDNPSQKRKAVSFNTNVQADTKYSKQKKHNNKDRQLKRKNRTK